MTTLRKYEPPELNTWDTAHLVTSGILSIVPGAPELFQYFVTPPLERRRDKWMDEVGKALQDLEENQGVKLEELQSNDLFITILIQASQAAVRNHQQEKIQSLRNAILNSALKINIKEDLQLLFIRYIDELTPSHFILLKFLCDNEQKLEHIESYEQLFEEFIAQDLHNIKRDEFKLLCDVESRKVIPPSLSRKVVPVYGVLASGNCAKVPL